MAPGDDHFRVRIVKYFFLNLIVKRVWLWFKISRSLLRLLQFDRVEVRADDYVPRLAGNMRVKPVPHEPDKVLIIMFTAFLEPRGRRFVLLERFQRM